MHAKRKHATRAARRQKCCCIGFAEPSDNRALEFHLLRSVEAAKDSDLRNHSRNVKGHSMQVTMSGPPGINPYD